MEEKTDSHSTEDTADVPKTLLGSLRATMRASVAAGDPPNDKIDDLKTVFVDKAAMKAKVRANLCKPTHNVANYYKETGMWQQIAKSPIFGNITLTMIGANAVWLAVDTDWNNSSVLINAHPVFQVAEHVFCAFFFLEWFVRFMAFKRKRDGCKDAWFVFDSFLVLLMVLETWVMTVVLVAMSSSDGLGDPSIMKICRLFRLSRMARMARLLRSVPEMMIMIKGMAAAMRSVFFTLCLLAFLIYVFAIAFTQLAQDTKVGEQHFSNVADSMYSLLLFGTLLDNVGLLSNRLGKDGPHMVALFFVFILFAALTVLNMLVGVLCEVVSAVAATEKEEMLVTYVNKKLTDIVSHLDKDGDMSISKGEFVHILENWDAVQSLQDVGVDVVGLVDFADVIFEDGAQELSFEKFMDVVLQLRGTNTATVKDIVELRKMVRTNNVQTSHLLARIEGRICSQTSKPGHVTPTLSTVSFDSIDLENVGIHNKNNREGCGVVVDSFPMPPLSSAQAMFMAGRDSDSFSSVDACDAGQCIDLFDDQGLPLHLIDKIVEPDGKAKQKTPAQVFEVLPNLKGQWGPCKPGEGMNVCKAMLQNMRESAESQQANCATSYFSEFIPHAAPLTGANEKRDPIGCADLQELRRQMASLGKLLSARMCEVERACSVDEVSDGALADLAHTLAVDSGIFNDRLSAQSRNELHPGAKYKGRYDL